MKQKTDTAIREMLITGYRHHFYETERQMLDAYMQGEAEVLDSVLSFTENNAHMLGPNPRRALMNSTICLVTVVCRAAIRHGAENEYCFALSDYYINRIEAVKEPEDLLELTREILSDFRELALKNRGRSCSPVIRKALRYIDGHLYEPCRIRDIAEHVKRNPNYLSGMFQKETGVTIRGYITGKKMELAGGLLKNDYKVTDVAEMLGFSSASHFSNKFYDYYGVRPSRFMDDEKRIIHK